MGKNNRVRHCKVCGVEPMPPGDVGYCDGCAALMTYLSELHQDERRPTARERAAGREERLWRRGQIHREPEVGCGLQA